MTFFDQNQTTSKGIAGNLWRGVTDHFRLRITSWFTSLILLNTGLVILLHPTVLSTNFTYRYMDRLYNPGTWTAICICLAIFRLAALTINGTFPRISYMPHIRTVGSTLSAIVWLQLVLGAINTTSPTIEAAVYPMLMLLDIYNTHLAAIEMRIDNGRRRNN